MPEVIHIPTQVLYKLAPEQSFWAKVKFQFNNIFDNTLAKQDLDFKYTVSWLEGAKGMVSWLLRYNKILESDRTYDTLIGRWETLEQML